MLERAHVLGESDFGRVLPATASLGTPPSDVLAEVVRHHVAQAYAKHGENKTHAAKALGISVNTLKKHLSSLTGEENA